MKAFFVEDLDHIFCRISLWIDFARVADEWNVVEIASIGWYIVDTPQGLFIPNRHLVRRHFLVSLYVDKAGSSVDARPLIGKVRSDMPRSGSSHAEACECDAIPIDVESGDGVISSFEYIRFPRAFPAIAVAAEGMDHDRAFGLKLSRLLCRQSRVDKLKIGCCITSPVQPNPHWDTGLIRAERKSLWNFNSIRLRRAIDRRIKTESLLAASFHPRCLVLLESIDPLRGFVQKSIGDSLAIFRFLAVPFLKLNRVTDRLEKNVGIRSARMGLHGRERLS